MRGIPRHLTYANVMSTLAVVLVIGGGAAYAADTIGSSDIIDESILSQDIKNSEVATLDVKNNQIRAADVRDDTLAGGGLTGADIKEETLAEVPDADELDGISSEGFKVGCPSGWKAVAGLCFEAPDASGQTLPQAVERCRQLGGRLPTYTELVALAKSGAVPLSQIYLEWTASSVDDDSTIYINSPTDTDNMDGVRANTVSSFARCVKTPVNVLGFPLTADNRAIREAVLVTGTDISGGFIDCPRCGARNAVAA